LRGRLDRGSDTPQPKGLRGRRNAVRPGLHASVEPSQEIQRERRDPSSNVRCYGYCVDR
jgi:hypothetical protein